MPEANVLYSVVGVVLAGLLVWASVVLKTSKEPWSRPAPPEVAATEHDTPEEKKVDPDDTAPETPAALSEGRTKAADEAADADVADKPADEEKKESAS